LRDARCETSLETRWAAVLPSCLIGGAASFWVFERIAAFWN
jgi:hypothetical protein